MCKSYKACSVCTIDFIIVLNLYSYTLQIRNQNQISMEVLEIVRMINFTALDC